MSYASQLHRYHNSFNYNQHGRRHIHPMSKIEELKAKAKAEANEAVKKMQADAAKAKKEPVREPETDAMRPTKAGPKKRVFNDADIQPGKKKEPRAPKAPGSGRMTEAELIKKYPHVIPGSLFFDEKTNKQSCRAKLACGHEATVHTSDLFQVKRCPECKKMLSKARLLEVQQKSEAKKAEAKKAAAPAPAKKSDAAPAKAQKAPAPKKEAKKAAAPATKDEW